MSRLEPKKKERWLLRRPPFGILHLHLDDWAALLVCSTAHSSRQLRGGFRHAHSTDRRCR
jgi:hypothetical protein